jgi:tryptophan 2-monooxygenase
MRTLFRGGVVFDGSTAPLADRDLMIKIASSGGFFSPTDDPMHPHFAQDELDQIVRTAADLGRPVMAHAHSPESIKRAVRAGVRSIEHGTYVDRGRPR